MRKLGKIHKDQIRKRKSFFPALILTFLLWIITVAYILFIDPKNYLSIYIFFIILSFALFFTLSIIFTDSKRGILFTSGLIIYLLLRLLGEGNILNAILIFGIVVSLDLYLRKHG